MLNTGETPARLRMRVASCFACSTRPGNPDQLAGSGHVRCTCDLYRDAGHDLLLVAQTLKTDGDVAELLATPSTQTMSSSCGWKLDRRPLPAASSR